VADETGGGGMHRLGNQLLFDKLGIFGDVSRFFGDDRGREIVLDLFEASFDGNDMGLEKTGDIVGNRLIDGAEGRIRRFRHGEDPVKIFQVGASSIAIFRH
jgi:hypothetical protein